jgi:hypothetical protein
MPPVTPSWKPSSKCVSARVHVLVALIRGVFICVHKGITGGFFCKTKHQRSSHSQERPLFSLFIFLWRSLFGPAEGHPRASTDSSSLSNVLKKKNDDDKI